ncbi:heavy-metal-associated domain-containing protein [Candidatus Woesearchaeota archaeon]|nr:heavy-metal-associated domain-containing protein [Candidatus Woesearchaeota archaeon]
MKKTIKVSGMTCGSCSKLIESELSDIKGIKSINVDLADDSVSVDFDSKKISLTKIKDKIAHLGFSPEGANHTSKHKTSKHSTSKNTFWKGVMYGLIPHIGCIAFIIGSILGVTVLMNFFKPMLMNRYFFHVLILISLGFATLSSFIYLKNNALLSWKGAKKKWQYLSIMYGSTIGINLILFMLIFPLLANVSVASPSQTAQFGDAALTLSVDIPCPGHAPLISEELKTINGVSNIHFSFPNDFEVTFSSKQTSKEEILKLEVFNEYPATVISESTVVSESLPSTQATKVAPTTATTGAAEGSCGGCGTPSCTGSCGGSCGG